MLSGWGKRAETNIRGFTCILKHCCSIRVNKAFVQRNVCTQIFGFGFFGGVMSVEKQRVEERGGDSN